jgi:hypothetical protein
MSDVVSEFDRTMAVRVVGGARRIPVDGLDAYARSMHDREPEEYTDEWLRDFEDLVSGQAVLQTPDGRAWCSSHALGAGHRDSDPGDNAFVRRLHYLVVWHKAFSGGDVDGVRVGCASAQSADLPIMFLVVDDPDLHRVFCAVCARPVDLEAEDAMMPPVEDDEEEESR